MPKTPNLPAPRIGTLVAGTRARTDTELVTSWVASLASAHTRRNFEKTARRFLEALPIGLRKATVEDVREALAQITEGLADATAQQYVLRVKSLLSYGHKLGYMPFNAGVTIKVKPDQSRAQLAKRIISEVEVGLLIREAASTRDGVMLKVLYAGGLRVSEIVGLAWADVIERETQLQLSVTGKGGRVRQVLLPEAVSTQLLALRSDAVANDPVFAARHGGPLSEQG
jgi:integrase/recombinase XerD